MTSRWLGGEAHDRVVKTMAAGAVLLLIVASAPHAQRLSIERTPWDGVFTIEQSERGRFAYAEHCATCHGDDLRGLPQPVWFPGQSPLTPALIGDSFARNWDGLTLRDLVERTRVSMPQQNPGSLSRATVTAIVAFMLQRASYPSGESELSSQPGDQATVFFARRRP